MKLLTLATLATATSVFAATGYTHVSNRLQKRRTSDNPLVTVDGSVCTVTVSHQCLGNGPC